jgi:hypothetical protein
MSGNATTRNSASTHKSETPELLCPNCDYNLRGLPEDRCPECGEPFDRAALIELLRQPSQTLPFGRDGQGDASYPGIFVASLFRPGTLGRELPAAPPVGTALAYGVAIRFISTLLSTLLFASVLSIRDSGERLFLFLLFAVFVSVVGYVCESVLAWLLASSVPPRGVPQSQRYRFWRTLCHCFSTHVACALILAGAGIAIANVSTSPIFTYVLIAIPSVMLVWWWSCLARAITQRSLPSAWRTVALMIAICLNPLFFIAVWTMWELGLRH